MDEEKLQERACRLVEEEDVPVLPPSVYDYISSKEKENEK